MTEQAPVSQLRSNESARRVVLVTGPSGAGRSSALNVLEDAGFEAIDNLPLRLVPPLFAGPQDMRPLALGIDPRTRDFSADWIIELLAELGRTSDINAELLYLDCASDVLLRRFSETRRRHPMAEGGPPAVGIENEIFLLKPLRDRADVLIDTSALTVHDLRAEVERWFSADGKHHLNVSVQSFSYKRGLPRSADMVYDCRFLSNPYWEPSLRAADGTSRDVQAYVAQDKRFAAFADQVFDMSLLLLPAFQEEGKSNVTLAFGCTGGQHRSVTLAETHALRLAEQGWQVSIRHRELDRKQESRAVL